MKKVAILQSNYIPWKGYFDLIAAVDEFILYDDMQYTTNDWRNRNLIKTPQGVQWLTIPVQTKGRFGQTIGETRIADPSWAAKHWKTLVQNYRKASFFSEISSWLEPLYLAEPWTHLAALNSRFITEICRYLEIRTMISFSWDYRLAPGKSERLADLCLQAGATDYVSGPAARNYLDENVFAETGIAVSWFDYAGYPEYPQLHGRFEHHVSILDLLFNCGPGAPQAMRFVPTTTAGSLPVLR